MNIEYKMRALRRAKKKRPMLVYHSRQVGGIDVPASQADNVFKLIKTLFKQFKMAGFDIQISHWGEIFIVEPTTYIPITVSVNLTHDDKALATLKQAMDAGVTLKHCPAPALLLSFRALRRGTRYRRYPIEQAKGAETEWSLTCVERIKDAVMGLTRNIPSEPYEQYLSITSEDVVCLINYGAQVFGPHAQLGHLARSKALRLYKTIVLEQNKLIIEGYGLHKDVFYLDKRSQSFLAKYISQDERLVLEN
ncbi:hypothetical protein ACYTPF_13765 [Alteromonas sp. HB246098]